MIFYCAAGTKTWSV